jgi:prolyl-tRNA synthetase
VIGDRGLKEGKVEYQSRRDTEPTLLAATGAVSEVAQRVKAALAR